MKKPLILFFGLALLFASCKKEYEDKVGTFTGTETYWEGNADDTLILDITTTTYTLSYDKSDKEYTLSSTSGRFPSVSFDRASFEDNSDGATAVFPAFTMWDATYYPDQMRLTADYEYTNLDDWRVCTFDGTK